MANHPSAAKRHRQSAKRQERNRHVRSTVKTDVKKVLTSVAAGGADESAKALRTAMATVQKAASKGVMTKKTASRKISRLSKKVHGLKAS